MNDMTLPTREEANYEDEPMTVNRDWPTFVNRMARVASAYRSRELMTREEWAASLSECAICGERNTACYETANGDAWCVRERPRLLTHEEWAATIDKCEHGNLFCHWTIEEWTSGEGVDADVWHDGKRHKAVWCPGAAIEETDNE